jgi:hypothetical protein
LGLNEKEVGASHPHVEKQTHFQLRKGWIPYPLLFKAWSKSAYKSAISVHPTERSAFTHSDRLAAVATGTDQLSWMLSSASALQNGAEIKAIALACPAVPKEPDLSEDYGHCIPSVLSAILLPKVMSSKTSLLYGFLCLAMIL